jgi:redox-sensitive bicupin YhaK (pirin superfamily)
MCTPRLAQLQGRTAPERPPTDIEPGAQAKEGFSEWRVIGYVSAQTDRADVNSGGAGPSTDCPARCKVVVQAGEDGIRFLLVSGIPIQEPVAWYGPLVITSQHRDV